MTVVGNNLLVVIILLIPFSLFSVFLLVHSGGFRSSRADTKPWLTLAER